MMLIEFHDFRNRTYSLEIIIQSLLSCLVERWTDIVEKCLGRKFSLTLIELPTETLLNLSVKSSKLTISVKGVFVVCVTKGVLRTQKHDATYRFHTVQRLILSPVFKAHTTSYSTNVEPRSFVRRQRRIAILNFCFTERR